MTHEVTQQSCKMNVLQQEYASAASMSLQLLQLAESLASQLKQSGHATAGA